MLVLHRNTGQSVVLDNGSCVIKFKQISRDRIQLIIYAPECISVKRLEIIPEDSDIMRRVLTLMPLDDDPNPVKKRKRRRRRKKSAEVPAELRTAS